MKHYIYCLLLILPLLTLIGCKEDNTSPAVQKVESLTIAPSKATMSVGETLQLKVTETPSLNKPVAFRSLNAEFATVSANGLVTAVAAGQTTIIAEVDGVSAQCQITVKEGAPQEDFTVDIIKVTATNIYIKVTPRDPEMLYAVNPCTRESYDRIIEKRGSMPKANREWWEYASGDQIGGKKYREQLNLEVFKGPQEFNLAEISGGSNPFPADHTIVIPIYGMDQDGYEVTKVIELEQKTAPRTKVDLTFEVKDLQPMDSYVQGLVRPSDLTKTYFYSIQRKSYVDFYRNPKPENKVIDGIAAQEMMCYKLVQSCISMNLPEAFRVGELQLDNTTNGNLRADSDYVLILFGWDKDLGLTTDPVYFDFHTAPAQGE